MPPKVKETAIAEVQVFSLDNLNPALLPELATFKESQLKVVEDNPFVVITDVASRELAKKYRTARVSARTALQGQDKLISSKFNDAKTKAKSYITELINISLPGELKQQEEISRDEVEAELKRQAKALLERYRIDNIKKELEDYVDEWKANFGDMSFNSIEKVSADFLESYTTYDLTVLEEFESLFPSKIEELTNILSYHTTALTEKENARLEKEKKDLELKRTRELISTGFSFDGNNYFVSDFKRLDMATILYLSDESFEEVIKVGKIELNRLAEIEEDNALAAKEAEAKIIADREKFDKEKADFEAKKEEDKEAIYEIRRNRLEELGMNYSNEHDTLWLDENADYILLASDVSDWGTLEFEETFTEVKNIIQDAKDVANKLSETLLPATIKGIEVEDQAIELIQNLDSLVPIETTANVCYDLPKETTWDSIAQDFTNSGGKSYSKWLKENYNVPTKIQ